MFDLKEYELKIEAAANNNENILSCYLKDPSLFKTMRANIPFKAECGSIDDSCWTVFDAYQKIVYVKLNTKDKLKNFLTGETAKETIRCILMDRLISSTNDDIFDPNNALDIEQIQSIYLMKGSTKLKPANITMDIWLTNIDSDVIWSVDWSDNKIEDKHNFDEDCKELVEAGIKNSIIVNYVKGLTS